MKALDLDQLASMDVATYRDLMRDDGRGWYMPPQEASMASYMLTLLDEAPAGLRERVRQLALSEANVAFNAIEKSVSLDAGASLLYAYRSLRIVGAYPSAESAGDLRNALQACLLTSARRTNRFRSFS